jgi:hypothetical protein
MALFRCFILGENFPGALLGKAEPVGFYTTRFVEASSESEAETLALDALRSEDAFNLPADVRSEDAKVYFESIEEVPGDTDRVPGSGFTFFVMGT